MAQPVGSAGAGPRRGPGPLLVTLVVLDVLLLAALAVLLVTRLDGAPWAGTPSATVAPEEELPETAPAEPTDPSDTASIGEFQLPSGNIACEMTETSATCTIVEFAYEPPEPPEGCAGTVGAVLTVTATQGPTLPCVSEPPVVPAAELEVLEYGRASTVGEMTCHSSTNGATCRHNPTGRGFSVARAGYLFF